MRHILFLCSQNRLRSPTAEQVYSTEADAEVASAGLDNDAETVCTPELVQLLHDRVDRHLRRRAGRQRA